MSIFSSILAVAKSVLPMVVPGAAPAIKAAESVIALIDKAKVTLSPGTDLDELNAMRDQLEAKVNAHATSTADRLDG